MQLFIERIRKHAEHVNTVGHHCTTEETTKQALILPLLDILGFSPFDPTRVKAEVAADFPGAKAGERVDYALYCHAVPVMFIEAKAYKENLSNHSPQLSRYFNATPEVAIGAVTNGREWRFFTDLKNKNVMDAEPFITVNLASLDESLLPRLYRFRHDEFQPEALRTLAEESVYIAAFKDVISTSLRAPDADFVRYVAGRANIQRQLNAKLLETITPLVKQAVEKSVAEMVVSGLSSRPVEVAVTPTPEPEGDAIVTERDDIIHSANARIVTTYAEKRLLDLVKEILGDGAEVMGKDTESYFSILFQGKNNRWLLRYFADRAIPGITLCIPLSEAMRNEITRAGLQIGAGDSICLPSPEHIARLSGILFDVLAFCKDDANFKRPTT